MIGILIETLHGGPTELPYGAVKRKKKIESIFRNYDCKEIDRKLTFEITNKRGKSRRICEASFLFLAGLIDTRNARLVSVLFKLRLS